MKVAIVFFCLGLWMTECTHAKTFPCDFNVYEGTRDGRITMAEFSKYTQKHGYDEEQSHFVFSTLDSNADGQIEVSEFSDNVPKLQQLSLIGRCTRHSFTLVIGK